MEKVEGGRETKQAVLSQRRQQYETDTIAELIRGLFQ
jgi:hypothetical protein